MSYYFRYNFVSPERIFAIIQEELKSYFDTGSVDGLMFNTYLDKALRKLGRATYVISETTLQIENFEARLPDNFHAVREAWMCTAVDGYPYQSANSFYSQAATASTIQVSPLTINGQPCTNPVCVNGCDECMPNLVQAVYKTNNSINAVYIRHYLLKPGNISAKSQCDVSYMDNWEQFSQDISTREFTPYSSTYDSFDIRDNKFVTNFREGVVDLVFYATEYDEIGNQLVPDNYRILEYIEAFIKYKIFETLTNQITDETFNQLLQKLQYYKQLSDEAYILALSEIRSQTAWDKQKRINQHLKRFRMYELPNKTYANRWKRNV